MKTLKIFAFPAILLAVLVTGFAMKQNEQQSQTRELIKVEGVSEFYMKPADDTRIWHITNRYITPGSENQPEFNTSEYCFSSDTVTVVNEYIGIPETAQWDLNLAAQNLK